MPKKQIVILGAGLTGLSSAYHLEKKYIDYRIFEKETIVGGLCRSKYIKGFTFDYNGHFLHFRKLSAYRLVKKILSDNLTKHARDSWVYCFGNYTRYPFQANLHGLPEEIMKNCFLNFINAKNGKGKKDLSFYDWIIHKFGNGIAQSFMFPYNQKFWKFPLKKISTTWVKDYIPVPNLEKVMQGAIKDNKGKIGYNAFFWYPKKGGIQSIADALLRRIKKPCLNHQVIRIDLKQKKIYFKNGKIEYYDNIISTIPLVEISHLLTDGPSWLRRVAKQLRWVSIFNLNLGIDRAQFSNRHWAYFPENEYIFYRAGSYSNISEYSAPKNTSSLYIEVSYQPAQKIDQLQLRERIINDLKKSGIILPQARILAEDVNALKYGYVIYDYAHARATKEIINFLESNGIFSIGRFGAWKYSTMEEALIDGKRIAEKLSKLNA